MEQVTIGLACGLARRGWLVRTIFPAEPGTAELRDWAEAQGVPAELSPALVHLGRRRGWGDIRALRRLVGDERADVVNIHYGANHISVKDLLAVRLGGRGRVVASVHHPHGWETAGAMGRRSTALAGRLATAVIANSAATRARCAEAGIPPGRLHLVPCGVRPPRVRLSRDEARRRLGLPAEAWIVGAVGRLVPEKRIDRLIEACATLPAGGSGPPMLVVVGDGPERDRLQRLAEARLPGAHRFLGRVADLDPVYAALDVFALPSDLEGFGLVYVEAALHGVPSVGVATGGTPGVIAHGETGLLVLPGQEHALSAALAILMADPGLRERMGAAARARAEAEFTEEAMAESYARILLG